MIFDRGAALTKPDQLTSEDQRRISAYEVGAHPAIQVCGTAVPRSTHGPRLCDVNGALGDWWAHLARLDTELPRNDATRAYVDRERVKWFRARQTLLVACADYLQRSAMLGDAVLRPEEPRDGTVSDIGYFGYTGVGQRLTCDVPLEIRLRVDPGDGSVTLLTASGTPT